MNNRYIVTWWAWFIWNALVWYLNRKGIDNIIIVDDLDTTEKWKNLVNKKYINYFDKNEFIDLVENKDFIENWDIIIHMGACSSTTESDSNFLMENNAKYSKKIYDKCKEAWARLIYASSAATYWDGSEWYSDYTKELYPLNMYWYSKYLFDQWVIKDTYDFSNINNNFQVVWLKFFNVFWPNEYHKGGMASMVYHWFNQIKENWKVKLFKSYKPEYEDWWQRRDFVYIKDALKIIDFFIEHSDKNWIFNVWTWQERTFYDLINSVFQSLWKETNIEYIDMPEHLKDKYQYYTKADMSKLKEEWYRENFYSLEEAVEDYVQNYLDKWYKIY